MHRTAAYTLLFLFFFSGNSCNRQGAYISHEKTLLGYVIGREVCHLGSEKDFWLIDFTYQNNQPLVGDTITINGELYRNVLKMKGLRPGAQQRGFPIAIDYEIISDSLVISRDCDRADAEVYPLKEIFAIRQEELR